MVAVYKKLFSRTVVLTTLIFVIGILVGRGMDELRSNEIFETLQKNELDTQSYLIEQEFLHSFAEDPCPFVQTRLHTLSKELGELGQYLVSYEEKNIFKQKEYEYLLRKYFLFEIKTYTLFSELNKQCQLNDYLLLYFFDPQDFISERQGKVLDALVEKNPKVTVFSINYNYQSDPTITTVKIYHNVTKTPTIIFGDNTKIESFINLEDLENFLKSNNTAENLIFPKKKQ